MTHEEGNKGKEEGNRQGPGSVTQCSDFCLIFIYLVPRSAVSLLSLCSIFPLFSVKSASLCYSSWFYSVTNQ